MSMVGNVYVRMMVFAEAGDMVQSHEHDYHHVTLVSSGAVLVEANGKETTFKSPHTIWIHKDVQHKLTALEPNTVCACIHAVRDDNGEIVDPSSIPDGVEFQSSSINV
jgi:quercetin dioxygenase-like cupin family protein